MSVYYIFIPVLILCTFKSALNWFRPRSRVIATCPVFPRHARDVLPPQLLRPRRRSLSACDVDCCCVVSTTSASQLLPPRARMEQDVKFLLH